MEDQPIVSNLASDRGCEAIEAKLSHLLGSISFNISVYGTFESGKFYESESIDFDEDQDRECLSEGRTFNKEELLARKLKRNDYAY